MLILTVLSVRSSHLKDMYRSRRVASSFDATILGVIETPRFIPRKYVSLHGKYSDTYPVWIKGLFLFIAISDDSGLNRLPMFLVHIKSVLESEKLAPN